MTISPYDSLAVEYYDEFHRTCRNFDAATRVAAAQLRSSIPHDGLVLDIGAGRGRCGEYVGIDPKRIVQLDSSRPMLDLQPREDSLLRVLHKAEALPFIDSTFRCICAFLCDAFWGLEFLAEVFRVLEAGGTFIATLPSYEWGAPLRRELGIDITTSRFRTKTGSIVVVPSILVPKSQVLDMLGTVGFDAPHTTLTGHNLPSTVEQVSSDISRVATTLGLNDSYTLPIVNLVVARK